MSDDEYRRQLEVQRRNFEAQFGSLEELGYDDQTKHSETESSEEGIEDFASDSNEELSEDDSEDDSEESDDETDFHGFDDEVKSTAPQPKVIKFTDPSSSSSTYTQPTKQQRKLLKSGKSSLAPKPVQLTKPKNQKTASEDSENLENDLELQRFLSESHILSNFQNHQSGADLTLATLDHDSGPIGKARTHTLKSRLEDISSTNGGNKSRLEKMPMSIRKGMIKSQIHKINKFEQEAKEGGIVLSKVKKGEFRNIGGRSVTTHERIGKSLGKKTPGKRQRGLQIQSVGRSTRNGLVISQGEIDRINGPSNGKFKGKKR